MTGGAVLEAKGIEPPGIEGGFQLVGGSQPRQVLAATEVGGGGVGSAKLGFRILRGKYRAKPLGMPLHNGSLQRDGDFTLRLFHHGILKQSHDPMVADGSRVGGRFPRTVGEIKLKEEAQSCKC
jgi:hypothetical protein